MRALEEIVAVGTDDTPSRRELRGRVARHEMTELAEALTDRWETRVRVTAGRTRGRLVVEFGSVADLDRILAVMAPDLAPDLRATLHGGGPGETAATAHISRENGQSG